jgi:RNA polymerase sigma factor (sigma-70 family)
MFVGHHFRPYNEKWFYLRQTALGETTTMDPEGSITLCVGALKRGDRATAQRLWEAYFRRLVALARSRLHSTSRGVADEEDVALSAFDSFIHRAAAGRFPRLEDRDDLWKVLFVLTVRKAIDHARREGRRIRAGVQVRSLEHLTELEAEQLATLEPNPELAAEMADECRRLFDLLGDESLRSVAMWKMEGYTNVEIAGKLGCVEQTVERKLQRIRRRWERKGEP